MTINILHDNVKNKTWRVILENNMSVRGNLTYNEAVKLKQLILNARRIDLKLKHFNFKIGDVV